MIINILNILQTFQNSGNTGRIPLACLPKNQRNTVYFAVEARHCMTMISYYFWKISITHQIFTLTKQGEQKQSP